MTRRSGLVVLLVVVAVFAWACSSDGDAPRDEVSATAEPTTRRATPTPTGEARPRGVIDPPKPEIRSGALSDQVVTDLDVLMDVLFIRPDENQRGGIAEIDRLGRSGDIRVAWVLVDSVRFLFLSDPRSAAIDLALVRLTGGLYASPLWVGVSDQLLKWEVPAPPGYVGYKRTAFLSVEEQWAPFFDDPGSEFDYLLVTWGGVQVDDRTIEEADAGQFCFTRFGCIPALRDPAVTDAAGGSWLDDDSVIFGVVINGEARAYPKHIMEVHEMVTDTVGGRRIGMPYCTLCGSAQAYFVDEPPEGYEVIELRTSGLLSRSNKVMFDLHTFSAFDTFTGRAITGPLREAGLVLEQTSVVASKWGDWKEAHPDTTIVAQDGGLNRVYSLNPLGGRDQFGPIFPVGTIDPRLPAQQLVVGMQNAEAVPIAFPVVAAREALGRGEVVEIGGVILQLDGSGLRATDADGQEVVSHEAFWFAWSQFWPTTLIWGVPEE